MDTLQMPFLRLLAVIAAVGLSAEGVLAMPTTITGSGFSVGINAGFGNAVGSNSSLAVTSNAVGQIDWVLTTGGGNLDNANAVVIYIDTDNGGAGFADTTTFTDHGAGTFDELRAAISASNGPERSDVFFAPGFNADYALAFNSGFGAAFKLNPLGHEFIDAISGAGFGAGGPYHFSHTFSDLGLGADGSFRYVLTYLDPIGTFRSNEFHGVAAGAVPATNIGFDDVTLPAGSFNTFISGVVDPFLNGDTDNDGVVEFEDDFFPIRDNWLETIATMPGLSRTDGDLNVDGMVDIVDFREWKDAYNPNPAQLRFALLSLGLTVPEPGAAVLAVLGCVAVARRRVV